MSTNEFGVCPVCKGLKKINSQNCLNCGGQTMAQDPRGYVNINKYGEPCTHQYVQSNVGRCLTRYSCLHCDHSYTVDSGD